MLLGKKNKKQELPQPQEPNLRVFSGKTVTASFNFECDMSIVADLRAISARDGIDVNQALYAVLCKAFGYAR